MINFRQDSICNAVCRNLLAVIGLKQQEWTANELNEKSLYVLYADE